MSPNGRRAWREWVRRQDLRRKHKQPKGSVCRMARQARRHIPLVPGAVLPKPPTTRSLVGMTMGARKRLYRYIVDALPTEGDVFLICAEDEGVPIGWFLAQRLRPCPGCMECDPKGFASMCDGSGVLPARQTAKSYKDDAPLQALRDWSHR